MVLELEKEVSLSIEEMTFEKLYEQAFPLVARFVSKQGGLFQDAKDICQDAFVIYYEKTKSESFVLRSTPEAYIVGIAKHLWIKKYNKAKSFISLDNLEADITIPDDYFSLNTKFNNKLLLFLEKSGKKCLEVLRAFYYDKFSMEKIAKTFGYSSIRSATVQKYKCLLKIKDSIKEKSISYDDFVE